jgi:hypothetical protein
VDKQELQLGVEGLRLINDGYYDLISLYGEYIHKASTNEVSERSFKEFADNKNLAKDLVSLLYGGDKYL